MPNCFTLTKKDIPNAKPAQFQHIDDAMREHFGAPANAEEWYMDWYNSVGLGLAMGNSFEKLREIIPDLTPVIDYLDANYTADSWYQGH